MKLLCNKFYLNIDSTIRFINKRSILDEILNLRDNRKLSKEAISFVFDSNQQKSRSILTGYNHHHYYIAGLDFTLDPVKHKF